MVLIFKGKDRVAMRGDSVFKGSLLWFWIMLGHWDEGTLT